MPYEDRLVVLAADAADAAEWRIEHPELADDARIIEANGRGWDALANIFPTTLALGRRAATIDYIIGVYKPRHVRIALELAEHRRRHVLPQVA